MTAYELIHMDKKSQIDFKKEVNFEKRKEN